MSLTGILLGLINVAIIVAVLILVGAIADWLLGWFGMPPSVQMRKFFLIAVALVALYMIIALLFGAPMPRIIHGP